VVRHNARIVGFHMTVSGKCDRSATNPVPKSNAASVNVHLDSSCGA
jgi:hypothetical protein